MNIVVVGGGASGLTSAIIAARNGCNVTILEKNSKCCKKLLLTGNGRCNFWNQEMGINYYHSEDISKLKQILDFKKDEVLDFFKSLGVVYKNINGYYYPYSNQSTTIANALINQALKLNVKIITDVLALDIEKVNNEFLVTTNKEVYKADKVIFAVGSKASLKNDNDKLYSLVSKFGHTITEILPSLTKIETDFKYLKDLKGVRSEVTLTLFENNQKIKEEHGEVLFNDTSISGICTFNLSGIVARGLNNNYQEEIRINFIPWFKGTKTDFITWFFDTPNVSNYTIGERLEGFLNYKVVLVLLKILKIKWDTKLSLASKDELFELLVNFKIPLKKVHSIKEAQVVSGGIRLQEINEKTMESLKVKGLFFTGEVLDVDGVCGGYNLGFAWISGLIAGNGVLDD